MRRSVRRAANAILGSIVTLQITPFARGCELTLVYEMGPKWAEYVTRTQQGWTTMLETLGKALH